jgi:alpha-1,2-mannosyltransferase
MRLRVEVATIGALAAGAVGAVISSAKVLAAHPEMYGIDLVAYVEAAKRLVASGTPYAPELHAGPLVNNSINIPNAYLYPPPLAQLFVPLSVLPMPVLAAVWAAAQAVLLLALVWAVYVRFGGVSDRRHLVAILLAVIAFHPNLVAIYVGNVSGWLAIGVACMLLASATPRAVVAGAGLWLKLTPGVFTVGAFFDRSTRVATTVAVVVIAGVSIALAPTAWADWVAVFPSVSGFYAQVPLTANLAPSHALSSAGLSLLADLAALAVPGAFMVLVVTLALRGRVAGWVAAGVGVYLSATGTSWDHYFVALTPIAVAAWPNASATLRWLIVAVLLWFGPLRFLDSAWLYHVIGLGLWMGMLLGAIGQFSGGIALLRRPQAVPSFGSTIRSHE